MRHGRSEIGPAQAATIASAWCLFYLIWSYPALQLAAPAALWLLSCARAQRRVRPAVAARRR